MKADDCEPLCRLLSDPKVMEFIEPPYSEEQPEQFLLKAGLSEKPLIYAAEKDRSFVGYVIYHDYDEESIEIGWLLDASCWGQGIATTLTSQMLGEIKRSKKHAVIECSPEQNSTIRIAEKFGFQKSGVDTGLLVYRL